ncbi:MAG: CHAT domain-containing protein [Caldilineales bacterium]|nr:CHAT domain-containing protein [Caldilineales bacterium]
MTIILDFNIHIRKAGEEGYTVTAQGPGTGLAGPEMLGWELLTQSRFPDWLDLIQFKPWETSEGILQEAGEMLFHALFRGQIERLFTGLFDRHVQSSDNMCLRLRLDIEESAVEVAVLPWELMHWRGFFLATQVSTLITRQSLNLDNGNIKPLTVAGRPRVLIVCPENKLLDGVREIEIVSSSLQKAGVPFEVLSGQVTVQALDDRLAAEAYHILHFIGLGYAETGEDGQVHGALAFSAPAGRKEEHDQLDHVRLQAVLGNHRTLKLVVLNTSFQDRPGHLSTAAAVLRSGIPAVIAMQFDIADEVAILFAEALYSRLTQGRWAGQVDMAVALARNACYLQFRKPDVTLRGFATPVLFLNAVDGTIFKLEKES